MTVLGVDPSLTSSGLCILEADGYVPFTMKPKSTLRGAARLAWLRDSVEGFVVENCPSPTLICLEGYAYGAKNQAHQLGELGGVLRVWIYEQGFAGQTVVIPPTLLKQFVTGRGNAKKEEVMRDAFKVWGVEGSNDQVDAFALAAMGWSFLGGGPPWEPDAGRRKFCGKLKFGLQ